MRKPGVRDHAVVGADRLAFDVPAALQHLERLDHAERRRGELLAQPADLEDRRQVREQDAAGHERVGRVLHDPPRLGQVEHDAVELALVDAVVDVADLDVERDVGAEEAVHVLDRALGEVVADLVAGDVTRRADGAQERGRERAGADARLEDRARPGRCRRA